MLQSVDNKWFMFDFVVVIVEYIGLEKVTDGQQQRFFCIFVPQSIPVIFGCIINGRIMQLDAKESEWDLI